MADLTAFLQNLRAVAYRRWRVKAVLTELKAPWPQQDAIFRNCLLPVLTRINPAFATLLCQDWHELQTLLHQSPLSAYQHQQKNHFFATIADQTIKPLFYCINPTLNPPRQQRDTFEFEIKLFGHFSEPELVDLSQAIDQMGHWGVGVKGQPQNRFEVLEITQHNFGKQRQIIHPQFVMPAADLLADYWLDSDQLSTANQA